MKAAIRVLVLVVLWFVLPQSIYANRIVGITSGYVPGTAPLVHIDPHTGQFTTVNTAGNSFNSLAQDSNGDIFAGSFSGSVDMGRVSRINPHTAKPLEVFQAETPGAGDIRGLSFDAADNLFAVVNRNDMSGSPTLNDDFYSIDLQNESTNLIGSLGFKSVQGFDISPSGDFFAWDIFEGLLSIDPVTGMATDVNPGVGGTADIQSIVFAPNGRLYGARNNLYRINPVTGEFTQIGTGSGLDVRGIEYIVPEPHTMVLMLTGILLGQRRF